MPLIKSGSRAAIGENIREMQAAGHPHNQAVAAALSNARKYGAKMAGGGAADKDLERAKQTIRGLTTLGNMGSWSGKKPVDYAREDTQNLADDIRSPRPPISYAAGGFTPPFGEHLIARQQMRQGFLHSPVPGRTDKLPITVGGGSYVLPADHLAAIGQGNSLAGAHIVNKMFGMGPFGLQRQNMGLGHAVRGHLNLSAKPGHFASGGFHTGKPTPIIAAGGEMVIPPEAIIRKFGDLKKGHEALDKWVMSTRKKHIDTLKNLKPPKKD